MSIIDLKNYRLNTINQLNSFLVETIYNNIIGKYTFEQSILKSAYKCTINDYKCCIDDLFNSTSNIYELDLTMNDLLKDNVINIYINYSFDDDNLYNETSIIINDEIVYDFNNSDYKDKRCVETFEVNDNIIDKNELNFLLEFTSQVKYLFDK
jgi:hypothetical protein